jgi:hypothetical protein
MEFAGIDHDIFGAAFFRPVELRAQFPLEMIK